MLMAIDEQLPPACAFAVSVLEERDLDPDSVPEEAVEAAQLHMATCPRCLNAVAIPTRRKKKKTRRVAEADKPGGQAKESRVTATTPPPLHDGLSFVSYKHRASRQFQTQRVQHCMQMQT